MFVCGTSYQLISITFTIINPDGRNLGSPTFDVSDFPYGGANEIINKIRFTNLVIAARANIYDASSSGYYSGPGFLMYDIIFPMNNTQVQIKRTEQYAGQPCELESTVAGKSYLLYG